MALNIKNPQAERLAEEVARLTGESKTEAIRQALLERRARLRYRITDGMRERLLDEFDIQEIPFGELHWREAVDGYRKFGKGRHPAGLNFGDCLTYAAAHLSGEPLLFVGSDFKLTDLLNA